MMRLFWEGVRETMPGLRLSFGVQREEVWSNSGGRTKKEHVFISEIEVESRHLSALQRF